MATSLSSLLGGIYTGPSGVSGYSGYSGSGISGYSGVSGQPGFSGTSGYSGSGTSGYSGSGISGYSGTSGYSGYSGLGLSGYSGVSGQPGLSGTSGYSGADGASGVSGYSAVDGASGFSGYSGFSGAPASGAVTAVTYQNRQLGASTNIAPGQNSLWLTPFYINPSVSASTILSMISITGTLSSATTGTFGVTNDIALYQINATNNTRFDTIWTYRQPMTIQMSGTNNFAFTLGTGADSKTFSTNSSAAFASNAFGVRMNTVSYGSVIPAGLYLMAYRQSTSSGGYSAVVRSYNAVFDNPSPVGKGFFGSISATRIGYNDAGVYATNSTAPSTTNAFPASVAWTNIIQVTDLVPYYKLGGQ